MKVSALFGRQIKVLAQILILTVLVACAQSANEDARYIATMQFTDDPERSPAMELRRQFAAIYAKPLNERGIQVLDEQRFRHLIPQEDISPILERYVTNQVAFFERNFSSSELATLTTFLRENDDLTIQNLLELQQKAEALQTLENVLSASSATSGSSSDGLPLAQAAQVLRDEIEILDSIDRELFNRMIAAQVNIVFFLEPVKRQISEMTRDLDNDVVRNALAADGILGFPSEDHRNELLRALSAN